MINNSHGPRAGTPGKTFGPRHRSDHDGRHRHQTPLNFEEPAIRLLSVLYPGDTAFDPPDAWWATPLGRVTARRAGHPSKEGVSFGVAGAMLGITRRCVHDLVSRNKLLRHPDGGVTVASIRARLGPRREQ